MNTSSRTNPIAAHAAAVAGVLATVSMAGVIVGEVVVGSDFMETTASELLGWAGFAAACGLVLGIGGLSGLLTSRAQQAWWAALLLGAAATTGGAATLALVVPTIVDRLPELATDPPAAVPATFIISSIVMGISGIGLSLRLRASLPGLPRPVFLLMIVGSVVAILPLPSRFFLLAIGVAALLRHLGADEDATVVEDADRAERVAS